MTALINFFQLSDQGLFSPAEIKLLHNLFIESAKAEIKNRKIYISLVSQYNLSDTMLLKIKNLFMKYIPSCDNISINVRKQDNEDLDILIKKSKDEILENIYNKIPSARIWLTDSDWQEDKGFLYIYVKKNGIDFLKEKNCHQNIERYFEDLGFSIQVIFKEKVSQNEYDIIEEDRKIVQTILNQNNTDMIREVKSNNHQNSPTIIGKVITKNSIPIEQVFGNPDEVIVEGEIFDVEERELKNKSIMVTFGLTDYKGSIGVKCFFSGDKIPNHERIKNGLWVKTRGKIEKNKYTNEYELIVFDINISEKPTREDLHTDKRVELHLHTKYSSMDAICSPKEVIDLVKSWGHKAVAFTDHGVVQSFPEIYDATRGTGVKPIYGSEVYIFDDEFPITTKPISINISDAIFVSVDIETTGLSFEQDDIIEIGAVKIHHGEVVDRFSSFVKPTKNLPPKITNLTGITNEMVTSAKPIQHVLPQFMDFLGDGIFVAHNAGFDSGFIRRDCEKLGLAFDNSVLDTLPFAQIVFTDLKNHRLNTLAKKLNIKMGNHHRALDDAHTAAMILLRLLKQAEKDGITNLLHINDIYKKRKGPVHLYSYHATVLVKDQQGLRNLYELVSRSHLDFFYRNPRIPKSLLNKQRQGLIIGSGCQAGELFQNILRCSRRQDVERIIKFYDFLEIQPIHNNSFLIDNGIISDRKKLEEINKEIYLLGKKFSKPVVMTGDVHFLNPEDEIYRKILLHAQGFNDADKDSKLYLKTTDEMLSECTYFNDDEAYEVVIKNTNEIADIIDDNIKPVPDELYPPKIEGSDSEIIEMTYKKAQEVYGKNLPDIVKDRIEKELNAIISNGFSVIYLIAHKLVKKSLQDGYLVGSRGSVGSSLVATMCDITEVNPLPPHYICPKCKNSIFEINVKGVVGPDLPDKICPCCNTLMKKDGFNIPFEVFMGFEGDKVPDIDLNFSGEYQSKAHKFTEDLFGKEHVFRAGTISTIAEKTAYGFAKSYLEDRNIDESSYEIKRLAKGVTGVKRTTGQHPGGVMVVPKDMQIYDFTPIGYPANDKGSGVITTHFDYHSISSRLLKLDLLGHDDPTVIKMLEQETGVDAKKIKLDDEKTMAIFSSLDPLNIRPEDVGTTVGTLGVPEFGTRFVRQMLEDTRPTTFSELVRISGLSHGTDVWLNNAQDLIKSGAATLKQVIATRDDIMTYLLNKGVKPKTAFSTMEAVRKGRGIKPDVEELLVKNNVDTWFIESCKKIKYLFPKAHAVAYVIMAFRIAYFKVHYPQAFYATYFTVRADDFDAEIILQGPEKIKETILEIDKKDNITAKEKGLYTVLEVANEMYLRGIQFLPIDLYKSDSKRFKIIQGDILLPISSIQGVGTTAAKSIEEERKKKRFSSIEDLRERTRITKTVIQNLRQNGVLKDLQETDQISLF